MKETVQRTGCPRWPLAFWIILLAWTLSASLSARAGTVAVLGSIEVLIEPPEAVADGATWSVEGRIQRESESVEANLFPGRHLVRFRDLPAWREPDVREVLVVGGKKTRVDVTYRPLPGFFFQAIPEQHAQSGRPLEFLVHADDPGDPQNPGPGAALVMTLDPQPVGVVTFDSSGRFRYTADPRDRLPFSVVFTAENGLIGGTVITPPGQLVPEDEVIDYDRPFPDEESRDFMTISEVKNPSKSFNDANRETLTVEISGAVLVFEENHPAALFQTYNNRNNIEELHLYADKVIIRSPLVLPQTYVSVHARELRFEGNGSLNTTPKARSRRPAGALPDDGLLRGRDGDPGHDGGNVDILVETFHSDPGIDTRFILRGGQGGVAGEGRNGIVNEDLSRNEDGSFKYPLNSVAWHNLMTRRGIEICDVVDGKAVLRSQTFSSGTPLPPCGRIQTPKGEDAVPSGRPGSGGNGGRLRSTINLMAYVDQAGGVAGAKGRNYTGGTLGRAFYNLTVSISFHPKTFETIITQDFDSVTRVPGESASAPSAIVPVGLRGALEVATDKGAWLHTFALRGILNHARAAYINGHEDEVRRRLADYRDRMLAYERTLDPEEELEDAEFAELANFDQVLLELDTLIHRIDSNLDYFGNPAGWVPMLSFEANLLAFENEVEKSIPILYLSYWLSHAAENLQNAQAASVEAKAGLEVELEDMIAAFNQAQLDIPRLQIESEAIKGRILTVRNRLAARLAELEARADQNLEDRNKVPFWKKAVGVLSVAADLIPIGQPTVGRIGAGLGLLAKVDVDKPLESASELAPKAFEIFSQKDITVCLGGTNSTSNTGTNVTKKAKQDKLKRLTECGKFLGAELKELAEVFKSSQVDKTELEKELEKLKAEDTAFVNLTKEVEALNAQKEQFALVMATAMQAVTTLTSAMTENLIATHELEERLAAGFTVLNHGALLHIKEMQRRAKDRLLEYQYFLSKAFQYRRLQPYSGTLSLNELFDRFQVLIEAGQDHRLSPADFDALKFVYVDELRQVVAEMFDNFNAPERSIPSSFKLTADELEALNTQGRVIINLQERGLLGGSRENVRLADLRARNVVVRPVGGSVGTHALTCVNFEHLGESRLTSGGRTFLFRHYQAETVNPIVWNAVHDGLLGTLENSVLSPAAQSLISVLLELEPTTDSSLLLFSRPAAWADILITKEVKTDNGVDMVIDDLHIEVQFDFYNTSGNERELAVEVTDGMAPVIVVSHQDINGRQDGLGGFRRVFSPFSQVTLQAPASYGRFVFDRWVINGQDAGSSSTAILVSLTANTTAEARYVYLVVTSLAPLPAQAGQAGFEFTTVAGREYTIEHSPQLADPVWSPREVRLGDGGVMQYTESVAEGTTGFYRLRISE